MNLNKLIEAINEMSNEKEMDRDQIISVLEATILQAAEKKYPQFETMEAVYNKENNTIELFYYKTVVEELYDENNEISLEEAHKQDDEVEPGDELQYEITSEEYMPIIGQSARQILFQKIKEIDQEKILAKYKHQVMEIVHGTVGRVDRAEVTVILSNKAEGVLDRQEQIYMEKYEPGDHIRALLLKILDEGKTPKLLLSRTHPTFLQKLMEIEIPEIYDGSIEIVNIAREPGRRAKVAVKANDPDVDPVGACIGPGGSRVHPVTAELHDERIDVVEHSDDITVFIGRALSSSQINAITVNTETKTADVEVESAFLSKVIGRQGQNVRLASRLTGYKINVFSNAGQAEDNADFDLDKAYEESMKEMDRQAAESTAEKSAQTENETDNEKIETETSPELPKKTEVTDNTGDNEATETSPELPKKPEITDNTGDNQATETSAEAPKKTEVTDNTGDNEATEKSANNDTQVSEKNS